ncbi:MAG: CinA family nicotinamide mononucleotide deamidase-related protein [Saprospiraceae bacterium]|nr:CinA family nicotinamide mononucleotide deamidase-related protein [Saprospiraceae bacterium]
MVSWIARILPPDPSIHPSFAPAHQTMAGGKATVHLRQAYGDRRRVNDPPTTTRMTAHLMTIGDEILIGQIVDTNSAWMSRQLNLSGIAVMGKSSVGDLRQAIVAGIEHAATTAQIVIMTGGLGPTKDDITKSTLVEMFEGKLVFHQEVYDRIAAYFQKINRPVSTEMLRSQAMLPDKAIVLPNKVGTASGMWFERDGQVFISLPGVPFEMEYLMTHEVLPRLKARFVSRPIAHRTLQTACEGETVIAKRIEAFEDHLPDHIKLAYLPSLGLVRLRLSGNWPGEVTPDAESRLAAELETKKAELYALIPDLVFGEAEQSLQEVVGNLLRQQGKQFGTAESCTGGYVAHLITLVPGSSDYFPGSIVSYSYEMKSKLLGVKPSTLETFGAVSEEAVCEMAEGARVTLGVDVSLAISGIAGPGGGTPEKPVGTVWMAVSDGQRTQVARHIFGRDRAKNIQLTGVYALNMVRKFLLDQK